LRLSKALLSVTLVNGLDNPLRSFLGNQLSLLSISNQKSRTTHPYNAVTLSTWFLESDLCPESWNPVSKSVYKGLSILTHSMYPAVLWQVVGL
jgi:hypothetical protein